MYYRKYTVEQLQKSIQELKRWCRTDDLDDPISEMERAMENAVEILSKPVPTNQTLSATWAWQENCGSCGHVLPRWAAYCPHCGRKVERNG